VQGTADSWGMRKEHQAIKAFLLLKEKKKGIHNLIFLASNTHPQHTISFVCRKRIVQPSFPLTVSHLRGKKSTAGSI